MKTLLAYDPQNQSKAVCRVNIFTMLVLVLFGLFIEGDPQKSIQGLWTIWTSEGGLVRDYVVIGGIGAAFLNSGLAMLLAIVVTIISGAQFSGPSLGACYIVAGFAIFGKNIPNMIPLILGTWLYSVLKKESFAKNVNVALWATCAGPIVQYLMVQGRLGSPAANFALGFAVAVAIGMVIPMVAGFTSRLHSGYLIYNVGFATGFVLTVTVALLTSFGFKFAGSSVWAEGYHTTLAILIGGIFAVHLVAGVLLNGGFKGLGKLMKYTGQLPCDYVALEGLPVVLINMGLLGLMMLGYLLAVGGNVSGPVVAGIITVGGFGGLGKNYYNCIWGVLGIVLLSFVSVWNLNDGAVMLGACFVTCICGVAGKYGPIWGIISGMLHVSIVRNIAVNYGWLNLYNNGYAAGIALLILLPVIEYVNALLGKSEEKKAS